MPSDFRTSDINFENYVNINKIEEIYVDLIKDCSIVLNTAENSTETEYGQNNHKTRIYTITNEKKAEDKNNYLGKKVIDRIRENLMIFNPQYYLVLDTKLYSHTTKEMLESGDLFVYCL